MPVACFSSNGPEALETIVHLWGTQVQGIHMFSPRLIQNLLVPSHIEELRDRLQKLRVEYVKGFFTISPSINPFTYSFSKRKEKKRVRELIDGRCFREEVGENSMDCVW